MSEWFDWRGGECPVAHDAQVAVRWRSGNTWQGQAADFQWHHSTVDPQPFEIVAYAAQPAKSRSHPPEQ